MASADVIQPSAEKYDQMEALLCNTSGKVPLSERFRILFTLKNIADDRSVEIIGKGNWSHHRLFQRIYLISDHFSIIALTDDDSALLKHELAYCLGQTGNLTAIPTLNQVLQNTTEHEMVRHEV